tara:strand:+ start:14 stop:538 length:525 start_codon:yes stop_codon:yes gene_type:complete
MNNDNCSICYEDLSKQQTCTLKCGHIFHTDCIIETLRKCGSKCPYCRDDYEVNNQDDNQNDNILRDEWIQFRRDRLRRQQQDRCRRLGLCKRNKKVQKLREKYLDTCDNMKKQCEKVKKHYRSKKVQELLNNRRNADTKREKAWNKYINYCEEKLNKRLETPSLIFCGNKYPKV